MAKSAGLVSWKHAGYLPDIERVTGNSVKQQKLGLAGRGRPGDILETFDVD